MALIPLNQQFHTQSGDIDTSNKGSELANSSRSSFTMKDIADTVGESKWEDTPNGNIRPKNSSNVAIQKEEAEFGLDVGSKSTKTLLTGTGSFDGFALNGTGTLFLTELSVGDNVELSDGQVIAIYDVIDDTTAYSFTSPASPTPDGEISKIAKEDKIANLGELIKVFFSGKIELENELEHNNAISKTITQDSNGNTYRQLFKATQPWGQAQYQWIDNQGTIKFIIRFGLTSGVRYLKLSGPSNLEVVTIMEDGSIELPNIASGWSGTNKLYKDSSGFLKIG